MVSILYIKYVYCKNYYIKCISVANGGYECDHCGKKFKQKKVLKGHLFRVYLGIKKTGPTTHVCTECQEVFPEFKLLRKHFKEYHPDLPAPEQHTAGPFLCVECGKELSSKHCLQMHEMTHTGKIFFFSHQKPCCFKFFFWIFLKFLE